MRYYDISIKKAVYDSRSFTRPEIDVNYSVLQKKKIAVFGKFKGLNHLDVIEVDIDNEISNNYDAFVVFPDLERGKMDYYSYLEYYITRMQQSLRSHKQDCKSCSLIVVFPFIDESDNPLLAAANTALKSLVKGVAMKYADKACMHGLQLSLSSSEQAIKEWVMFLLSNKSGYCIGETFYI